MDLSLPLPGDAVEMPKVMFDRFFSSPAQVRCATEIVAFLHKPMLNRQIGIG
jgi:hypothetical protein